MDASTFRRAWRELKAKGWTYKASSGLDSHARYLRPNKTLADQQGVDLFVGDAALIEHLRAKPLEVSEAFAAQLREQTRVARAAESAKTKAAKKKAKASQPKKVPSNGIATVKTKKHNGKYFEVGKPWPEKWRNGFKLRGAGGSQPRGPAAVSAATNERD